MSSRPPEQGGLWRYRQSIWVLPAFVFGIFTWLSFFIVGFTARRRDWILTGAAYSVYSALFFFALSRPEIESDDTANALLGIAVMVAWIGGVIQALVVNRAYLRQLDAAPGSTRSWPSPARGRATARVAGPAMPAGDDLGLGFGDPAAEYLAAADPLPRPSSGGPPTERLVEANTARERTLRRLPGVTPERARRWVSERRRRGGFRDIDDLAGALELQPHEIVRLRPLLSFTDPGERRPRLRPTRRGRVLDV